MKIRNLLLLTPALCCLGFDSCDTHYAYANIHQYQAGSRQYFGFVAPDPDNHNGYPNVASPSDPGEGWVFANNIYMSYGVMLSDGDNLDVNGEQIVDHVTGQIMWQYEPPIKETGNPKDTIHWYIWTYEYGYDWSTGFGFMCSTLDNQYGYDISFTLQSNGSPFCYNGTTVMTSE